MNYKGFDKDLKCRGFQYEIGKEYECENAVACETGFHACERPLDVFSYYPPASSRYCEVEQSGKTDTNSDDSKVASTKIKIGAEIARRIGLSAEAVNRLLRQPRMAQQEGMDHFCDSTEQIQMCLACPLPDCKASGRLCPLKEGKTP